MSMIPAEPAPLVAGRATADGLEETLRGLHCLDDAVRRAAVELDSTHAARAVLARLCAQGLVFDCGTGGDDGRCVYVIGPGAILDR